MPANLADLEKRLWSAADELRANSKLKSSDEGGLPFLNLKCIGRGGSFRYDGVKRYIGECKPDQTARTGDIVVAVTDMTQERRLVAHAARVHVVDHDFGVISMDLIRVEPKAKIPKGYLHGLLCLLRGSASACQWRKRPASQSSANLGSQIRTSAKTFERSLRRVLRQHL
jgi:hypothetical protein